jgi:D-alanyl-D-alanine carboxypeptidase/D-alanyl-D-alanine-endopeptidase (penicillin-binding protein 4)
MSLPLSKHTLSTGTLLSCLLWTPLSFFASTHPADASEPFQQFLPKESRSGLLIKTLNTKATKLSQNVDSYFTPASTLKLVTALAAKLELGDRFRFTTTVNKVGNHVVIKFSGDPTLTTADLTTLLTQLKQKNGSLIKGDLWLDNTAFTGYDRAIGWPWDNLGVCYSAPSSATTLDSNCAQASIYTQKQGSTRVYVPEQYPLYVLSNAKTMTPAEQKSQHCTLELESNDQNEYHLDGCLTLRDKPLPLKFAIQNTDLFAHRVVHRLLNQLGIELKGSIQVGMAPKGATKTVALHHSAFLPELLATMLQKSDNLIADNLLKTIGQHRYAHPGSFNNGTAAVKLILLEKANIDLRKAQIVDGSGLSRNNRMTVNQFSQILDYIWRNDARLKLIGIMAKSGESGTLRYRRSMNLPEMRGHMIAKSGSLYGSYNMAGFGVDKSGRPKTLFVQMVGDYFPEQVKEQTRAAKIAPLTQFEKAFYSKVIQFSQ